MFHSDRGSQNASKYYRDSLKEYGINSSMSRRGNCWDNACSETLFESLKVGRLNGQKFKTKRDAKDEAIDLKRLTGCFGLVITTAFEICLRQPETVRA